MVETGLIKLYKSLRFRIEVSKLRLEMLEKDRILVSVKLDKSKDLAINNEIAIVEKYLENIMEIYKKTLELIKEQEYKYCTTKVEGQIFYYYIIKGLSAKETLSMINDKNVREQTIYNVASAINKQIASIKIKDNILSIISRDEA